MKHLYFLFFLMIFFACDHAEKKAALFQHFTVSDSIPVPEKYSRYGTPALADLDNDGDIDFVMSITKHELFWFEFLGDHQWDMHVAGQLPIGQLGGGTFDVDNDGWMDIVIGGIWYRNPHDPKGKAFERIEYDTAIDHEIHDLMFKDIDGDQKEDLVVLGDKEGMFWYEIPDDPLSQTIWEKHLITMDVLNENVDIHGGFFPGGIGDIDGDGDNDIALPNRWYENVDAGEVWNQKFLPWGSGGYWGLSGRSWILDMDLDGDNDIVMVSGDQKDSRGAWLENDGKENPKFEVHILPMSAPGRRGSFHSLWVGDFDMDGDQDIFTMDQEDETILPEGAGMKAYIWENMDGKGQEFVEKVVLDKNIGGHDCLFADIDGDGDLDAYFKVWSNLPTNAYGGKPHVDYLENTTIH